MSDRALYAKLLGLDAPWDVVNVEADLENGEVRVFVERQESEPGECPKCGKASPRHDTRERSWRHLDTMQYKTILTAQVPRVKCKKHGVLQIKVPWGEPRSRFTALFESLAIDWLQEANTSAVARKLDLSWDEVDGIMKRAVERGLVRRETSAPVFIGVDETSFQKRHEYVTVVCDLEAPRGQVLYVADNRTAEALSGYFEQLTEEQREDIAAVAMDMHAPYIKATRDALHKADEVIIFDKFHIAKHFGDAVNKIRREEHKELMERGDDRLSRTRYTWLRSYDSFSPEQWRAFAPLRTSNLRVARAWAIKDTASQLWFYKSEAWAEKQWKRLLGWMARSRLPPMVELGRTIRRHFKGVINAVLSAVTNARAEAINSRIQWIKKQACGFRSRERFRNAIYFHLGGLDLYPETAR